MAQSAVGCLLKAYECLEIAAVDIVHLGARGGPGGAVGAHVKIVVRIYQIECIRRGCDASEPGA